MEKGGGRHSGKGDEGILGGDPDLCTWVIVSLLPLPMQILAEPTQHRLSFFPDRRGGCFSGLLSELGCLTYIPYSAEEQSPICP